MWMWLCVGIEVGVVDGPGEGHAKVFVYRLSLDVLGKCASNRGRMCVDRFDHSGCGITD